ncbi:MAG: FlgD immunoglobulin-like domain containing protein, partial [Gemmatimonadota bacterium]|nr:FlgD immunoglobulin-like domain containing protein [Gemmatimonadota bacterium]
SAGLPRAFALGQNHPNPFNPSTTIEYYIPSLSSIPEGGEKIRLEVFDLRGGLVATLVDAVQGPGRYSVNWDGRDGRGRAVPSGVYFYRLRAGSFSRVRKMVMVK